MFVVIPLTTCDKYTVMAAKYMVQWDCQVGLTVTDAHG